MGEWKEYKISEIADVIGGGTPKTSIEEYWNGDIPWLSVVDFNTGRKYVSDTEKTITNLGLEKSSTKLLQQNDIIISARGTVGALAMLAKPMTFNQSCYGLRAKYNLSVNDYLFYLLKNTVKELQQVSYGAVFDTITRNTFDETDILLPPLEQQKAIAEVLSSLDDKIDLLHSQNKTLEELAQTLFRQWFIEEAKDDWEVVTVGKFVKTNVSTIKKDSSIKTIQYLDTSSLTEGKIDTFQQLNLVDAPSRARRIVKHNNVLISTVRPNQKHYGIMKNPTEDIVVSTGFCVISCEKINPHFIYMLLTTDDMTEYLHSIAEGSTSTYPSLKPSDIEAVEFLLPQEEKLKVFSDYADNVWNKIDSNYIQMKTLENMRDTLLPKLMSGEVRVKF